MRTESLPNKYGVVFSVGNGVHWGYNGDRDPGTVVKISKSGRQVFVSSDQYKIIDKIDYFTENDRECEFTTVDVPEEHLTKYTLRKSGHFTNHPKNGMALCLGRCYARNPHI